MTNIVKDVLYSFFQQKTYKENNTQPWKVRKLQKPVRILKKKFQNINPR